LRHASPAQQLVPPAEQLWPAPTHEFGWQVPVVPLVITHAVPLQQSAALLQTAPCGWQVTGGAHVPLLQICEQHCAENWQLWPLAMQTTPASTMPPSGNTPASVVPPSPLISVPGRHAPWMQKVPAQHSESIVHASPSRVQVGAVQR
jgi:hypothetical protein